ASTGIGTVQQAIARRIQFGDECILATCVGALISIEDREVERVCSTGYIGAPRRIYGHRGAGFIAQAAEIGTILRRAGIAELGHKAVFSAAKLRLIPVQQREAR